MRAAFKTRRFRFSLRALLIVTAIAGVAFAWIHNARQQRVAAAALRASNPGATLVYDDENQRGDRTDSILRAWVRDYLGVDYAATVSLVELHYATDVDVACLARLPQVRVVVLLRSIDLTDAGLARLAALSHLKRLTIHDAEQITDAGLRHLERLTTLEYLHLDLGRHAISEKAVESLHRALPGCRIELGIAAVDPDLAFTRR